MRGWRGRPRGRDTGTAAMSTHDAGTSRDSDYYCTALATHHRREGLSRSARLSSAWSARQWKKGAESAVADLRLLLQAGRSFARVVGAPSNTSVTYAQLG